MTGFAHKLIRAPTTKKRERDLRTKMGKMMKNSFFRKLVKSSADLDDLTGSTQATKKSKSKA